MSARACAQTRELGPSIEVLIQALRLELPQVGLTERFPFVEEQLDAVAGAARIAPSYVAGLSPELLSLQSLN